MASTNLFAPKIRTVQPAFVYENNTGGVDIYFSLSAYNKIDDISGLLYTIIDPNKVSTWGTNSMIKTAAAPLGYIGVKKSSWQPKKDGLLIESDEYYFHIDLTSTNYQIFTRNQYYQVQLYLVSKNLSIPTKIDNKWYNANKDNISVASQASLIRPITAIESAVIDTSAIIEENLLRGEIIYSRRNTVEGIESYSFDICDTEDKVLYSSSVYTNTLGTSFEQKINYYFDENVTYRIKVKYTTVNGYQDTIDSTSFNFNIDNYSDPKGDFQLSGTSNHEESGSVCLELAVKFITISSGGVVRVQHASELTEYKQWVDIATLEIKEAITESITMRIYDNLVEAGVNYKYRFFYTQGENKYLYAPSTSHLSDFGDIFLSDKNTMLAVKYNPNITNFKWVTQESLTNTLGSQYPVVRKNGDTYYKQFNISGTLYFDIEHYDKTTPLDSRGVDISSKFKDDECSLYLSQELAFDYNSTPRKKVALRKKMREYAMQFLTNGGFKLFRSLEEGNMIVYLSNVSFTPNKTLNRHIYDFSATITEVAEATDENLIKYGFKNDSSDAYYIVLQAITSTLTEDENNSLNEITYTVWVNASEVIGANALKLTAKRVVTTSD